MSDSIASTGVVVNGVARTLAPGPDRTLLFVLREESG